jgi:hypothetical protein
MWIVHIGIKNESKRLWYIRNQWIITFLLSKGRASNQIINVSGNVTMTKQMLMSQTIIDLNTSIKIHLFLCVTQCLLCEPLCNKKRRTDTEKHREGTGIHRVVLRG